MCLPAALFRFLRIEYINGYLREGKEGVDFCCGTTEYMGGIIGRNFGSFRMMVFPAGACSRLIDGKVQDVPWSKALRIKVNIAMGFLPDELYRNRGKKFKIIFGKPIPYSTFDSSKKPIEWAAFVRGEVYKL